MPYDPKAIDQHERSYAYNIMWLGLPVSIVLSISMFFEAFSLLTTLSGGFVSGIFISLAWSSWRDEFLKKELAFASNWALSFAGLVLFLQIVPIGRDYPIEARPALALMGVIFNAALTFRRLKDR